jgi:hypothetical protein
MVSQELVNSLEGAVPVVQVERSSIASTVSRIVELKAMGFGTHVEYPSRTNKLKNNKKEKLMRLIIEGLHRHLKTIKVLDCKFIQQMDRT